MVARQRAMGWTVLEDTTVYLRRGADSISLTGLSFDPALRERRHDRDLPGTAIPKAYAGVPDSLYNIALVHIPQLWEQIVEAGYGDLTLSGHVHSMQLKIRPWGRGWSPVKWIYKHWSGRYDTGRHTLYVNDGTGYVAFPMRLGAWPEVTLFTLRTMQSNTIFRHDGRRLPGRRQPPAADDLDARRLGGGAAPAGVARRDPRGSRDAAARRSRRCSCAMPRRGNCAVPGACGPT